MTAHSLEFTKSVRRSTWLSAIWIAALVAATFGSTLAGIVGSWFDDKANMGHGVFVPIAAGYMIWLKRDNLSKINAQPSMWGLLIVLWAAAQAVLGVAGQFTWLMRTAFVISIAGCIMTLYGFRVLYELAYPLFTLLLMITPPSFIFERITLPLQVIASRLGELALETLGYSVLREGNILELVGERLSVEEACSGIRSLIALFFLGVVYGYFFIPERIIRVVVLVAIVPIAIICNAARIVATGVMGQFNRELAHGMLHETFGHFGLIAGAVLVLLLHRIILKLRSSSHPGQYA
jgi:exosortase